VRNPGFIVRAARFIANRFRASGRTRSNALMKTPNLMTGALCALLVLSSNELAATSVDAARNAIAEQSRVFTNALERGDAPGAARVFSADARLLVAMVDGAVVGREGIEKFWQGAMNGGLKALKLTTIDLEGDGAMRVETGDYAAIGAGGAQIGRGHYLFVWRKESGEWKIFRDMGNASPAQASGGTAPSAAAPRTEGGVFPAQYAATFETLGAALADKNALVTTTYANSLAASVRNIGQVPYPDGAVIVMEYALSMKDGEGELLRDSQGGLLKGEVVRVDVMRRGRGFGAAYGDNRAGDWEFSSYRRDGSTLIPPVNGADCAACHRNAGADKDFVFRARAPLAAH
jgi:ketosteroid isomerase-like protein